MSRVESMNAECMKPPPEKCTSAKSVCTIGYQGSSVDAFFNKLQQNGINILADARSNPWSRRKDFSKKGLQRECERLGIEYCGFPQLGIRATDSEQIHTPEDRARLLTNYGDQVLQYQLPVLMLLYNRKS